MAVTITTTGSTFEPVIELVPGSAAVVTWSCPGFGDEVGLTPTFAFGSSATRTVTMTVTGGGGPADVTLLNMGYDPDFDVGNYMPSASLAKDPEAISGLGNVHELTGLIYLLADDTALGGALDLSGMAALMYLQLAHTNVTSLDLTGCTALIRLQAEGANLSGLDLNPVAGNLRDLRAAVQQGPGPFVFATLTSPLVYLYHYCVRDQRLTNSIPLHQMPSLEEFWAWNCDIPGSLDGGGNTLLRDVRAFGNRLTAINFAGCSGLAYVELFFNLLGSAQVDKLLADIDAFGTSEGYLDVSVNTAPSAGGDAHVTALEARDWTVSVDAPSSGEISIVQVVDTSMGTFDNPISPGSSIVMLTCAASGGEPITTHSPLLGGFPTTIAVKLQEEFVEGDGNACYHAVWLWPHCSAGDINGFGVSYDGGFELAAYALEVAGLGVTPVMDKQSSDSSSGSPPNDAIDSGATGPTSVAESLVVGCAQTWAGAVAGPDPGWTVLTGGPNGNIGYRLPGAIGSFRWAQTADYGDAPWTAGVVTLAADVPPQVGYWGIHI